MTAPLRLLVVVGSLRGASLNRRLAGLLADVRDDDVVDVEDTLDALPFYDADVEADGVPGPVAALRERVAAADALVVVTPEHNRSVPGVLANALDWLSRPYGESALTGLPVVVMTASPSRRAGQAAADHLRVVLTAIGADVLPTGYALPRAHEALADEAGRSRVRGEVAQVLARALDAPERLSA